MKGNYWMPLMKRCLRKFLWNVEKRCYKSFCKCKGHMWSSVYKLEQVLHRVFKLLFHTQWESINIFDSWWRSKNVTNKERVSRTCGMKPHAEWRPRVEYVLCLQSMQNLGHCHHSAWTSELESSSFIQQASTDERFFGRHCARGHNLSTQRKMKIQSHNNYYRVVQRTEYYYLQKEGEGKRWRKASQEVISNVCFKGRIEGS